ncbi:MAG: hypothetical protein M3N95_06855 [Actinomycetota bacterium]|nr:hypothetical protein [Actinomycetota bacterium]
MSDQQQTSADIETGAHSQREVDPERQQGSDVGGPAATGESGVESSLEQTSTVAEDDAPDSQARNPL